MIPVILSGGSGSRLWPISRSSYPKQFCDIFDEPLLEKTLKRVMGLGNPYVITVESLRVLTDKCVTDLGMKSDQVIYEPSAKNTAPAIALICQKMLLSKKENEILGIFPADHLISDEKEFKKVVQFAKQCAEKNQIVTVGIEPDYPATGFGYIECNSTEFQKDDHLTAKQVQGFREKPNLATAEKFLSEKRYYWNAGMFIFKVSTMVKEFQTHMPELWKVVSTLKSDFSNLKEVYEQVPSISIDYGIMEKATSQVCIPCRIGWSDLGSWDDFAKLFKNQPTLGASASDVHEVHSKNNFVFSLKQKLVGMVGVEDLIVIDTPDALLISKKGASQEIKTLVEDLNKKKNKKTSEHSFDFRPWGQYEVLSDTSDFKIKVIKVNPGAQLSYQSHEHRSEHWVVIEGEGDVIINEQALSVFPGSSIVIPENSKHRIKNTGTKVLRFVEVQTGDYFGEDDIKRYQDDYKRI
jgi:mannose-1-phosphate guanylyltransferase/mannose-6-phosphate isomerase